MEVGSFSLWGEAVNCWRFSRYPKQMTWPSAAPTPQAGTSIARSPGYGALALLAAEVFNSFSSKELTSRGTVSIP